MRSTLTFCQGPWGLVHPCAMPDAASHSSNGRERHPVERQIENTA